MLSEKEIDRIYQQEVSKRGIGNKIGMNPKEVYDLRNRKKVSLGDKLEILLMLKKIQIISHDEREKSNSE
ncbi:MULTISPECIES: hypothetical protein [Weeksella]|uniref:hypothetical protein n=1 Tax=Weeksella TaxID=1013 RepID=UPI0008A104B6|nr:MULTISPECIES: hypothetical protein [Weeksella]MDK7375990.1 hypothetical protein [Weeksella virosa]OFM84584.1 hypothetical protein HMPREF2660_08720 [Weeksella sp. HMSC059D05]